MNVVWHNHPSIKAIPFLLEKAYSPSNKIANLLLAQPAGPRADVKEPLNLAAEVALDFLVVFRDFDSLAESFCRFLLRIEAMQPLAFFALYLEQDLFGQGIGQPESNEI